MADVAESNGQPIDSTTPSAEKLSDFEQRLLEDPIDQEINVGGGFPVKSTPTSTPTSTPSRRGGRGGARGGRSSTTEIDTRWFVPFQHGWKREVVQRASTDCYDTYYFPPEGKKVRSLVDIEKHLDKHGITDLTKDNFSFTKRIIYKEPYDMMRTARPVTRSELGGKDSPAPVDGVGRGRGRGRGKGRGGKFENASDSDSSTSSMGRGRGQGIGQGIVGLKRDYTNMLDSPSSTSNPFPNISNSIDVWNSPPKPKKFKQIPSINKQTVVVGSIITPVALHENKVADGGVQANVPRFPGIQPIRRGPVAKKHTAPVTKPVAKKRTFPRPPTRNIPLNDFPGMAGTSTLCGLACPGREGLPPTLHCQKCMMLFHPACVGIPAGTAEFSCKNCGPMPKKKISVEAITIPASSNAGTSKTPNESVSTIDLSKVINQNQVSGQLLTLPPGVLNHLDMSQPLALKVNNKVLMIPPNCFILSDSAVKVFLPPGTLPNTLFKEKNLPINFNFYAKNNEQILNFTDPGNSVASPVKDAACGHVSNDDKENVLAATQMKLSHKQVKVVTPPECHFLKLHSGYDCMINIFKFLTIADLLRAARVCRTWAKVTSQDMLWKVVKLNGSRVSDWEQAARRFKNHNTWFLDLQGMLLSEDRNRTWHQFTAVLENLGQLRHIHFGHSPACILHAVVEKLDKLEVLSAESVTDMVAESQMGTTKTKIDIGKFAALKQLEHLKLRGVCGLVLPAFSFSGKLVDIAALTNLKTLMLTTMRNIPDTEFLFLSSLKDLEVLEIGDCDMWTEQVYTQLGTLAKLKSLRLENGGDKPEPALGLAIKEIKGLQKLELIKFAVDANMEETLKELTELKSLTVWPITSVQVPLNNTNTLKAMKSLTQLKTLEWGILSDGNAITLQPEEDGPENKVQCLTLLEDQEEEVKERKEKFISIEKLREQLEAGLASTKINICTVTFDKDSTRAVVTPIPAAALKTKPTVAVPLGPQKVVLIDEQVVDIDAPSPKEGDTAADPVDLT